MIDPDKPFFFYFATGACHSPHQAPARGSSATAAPSTTGWDAWRRAAIGRRSVRGAPRRAPSCRPDPTGCPRGTRCRPTSGGCTPATWRPSPGSSATPTTSRPAVRLSATDRRARQHDAVRAVGQRGQLGGRADRLGQRRPRLERRTADGGGGARPASTRSVVPLWHNNYPWGWTMAGNTPFRRWKREVHEGGVADPLIVHWPARHPDGPGERRQYVHAIDIVPDRPRGARRPGPGRHRRRGPATRWTGRRSPTPSPTPERAESSSHSSTTRCSGAERSIRTVGKRSPTTPSRRPRAGLRRRRLGALRRRPRPSECHDLADASSPTGSGGWWTVGGSRPRRTTSCPSTTGPSRRS